MPAVAVAAVPHRRVVALTERVDGREVVHARVFERGPGGAWHPTEGVSVPAELLPHLQASVARLHGATGSAVS